MQRSVPASSSSISAAPPRSAFAAELQAAWASWRAMTSERLYHMGVTGGIATWLIIPVMTIVTFSIVYGVDSSLFRYLVVAQACNALVMNTAFWVGEILDRERVKGTLVCLFLAPCSRFAWLSGFILAGVLETLFVSALVLLFGWLAFGVTLSPNFPALAISVALLSLSLWGMGVMFSGVGLMIKKANPLANLVYTALLLLGGVYFPTSELPDPLRYLSMALPVGYGIQAIADSALYGASLRDIAPNLLPLAGFALTLPFIGALTFTRLERAVRMRGELDLY